MAKKTKRQARKTTFVTSSTAAPAAVVAASGYGRQIERERGEFNPDYTPTVNDLHRIGVIAGVIFASLIALALILPLIIR